MAPRLADKPATKAHKGEDADAVQSDTQFDKAVEKTSRLAVSKLPTPARARARAVTPTQPTAASAKSETSSAGVSGVKETSVRPKADKDGYPVWLHVYDLGPVSKWALNSWAAEGAWHVGLEVLGVEFSYQAISTCTKDDDTTSGLTWHHPKAHPRHVYHESIWLGCSSLKVPEIGRLLEDLEKVWLAKDYHCLRKNCTDFAKSLSEALKVPEPFPAWVHGIAKGFLKPAADVDLALFPQGIVSSSCSPTSSGSVSSSTKSLKSEDRDPSGKEEPVEPKLESARVQPPGQRLLCGGTLCFVAH